MTTSRSETMTGTVYIAFPEYDTPPADPIKLMRAWFDDAQRHGVREPRALALATADARGRPSSRTVAVNEIADAGLIFATHLCSRKGREMTENPWASGVFYWRETSQQIIVSGPVERVSDERAERLWASRPVFTHAMSVASRQSEEIDDAARRRLAEAQRIAATAEAQPRPARYVGFMLRPEAVEFWADGDDRLHKRLRYDSRDGVWTARQLQP